MKTQSSARSGGPKAMLRWRHSLTTSIPDETLTLARIVMKRASKRSFSPTKIEPGLLELIISMSRWSPSASNSQPWRIIIVNPAVMKEALYKGNEWALKASHIVVIVSRQEDDRTVNGIPYHFVDCGAFALLFTLLCTSLGILAHPMAGFEGKAAKLALQIPADYAAILMIAVGYQGDPTSLNRETRDRDFKPRTRKPLEEVMCWNKWGFARPGSSRTESEFGELKN